jgi:hypothetical protein
MNTSSPSLFHPVDCLHAVRCRALAHCQGIRVTCCVASDVFQYSLVAGGKCCTVLRNNIKDSCYAVSWMAPHRWCYLLPTAEASSTSCSSSLYETHNRVYDSFLAEDPQRTSIVPALLSDLLQQIVSGDAQSQCQNKEQEDQQWMYAGPSIVKSIPYFNFARQALFVWPEASIHR